MTKDIHKKQINDPFIAYSPDFAREDLAATDRDIFDKVFCLVNERIAELIDRANKDGGHIKALTLNWRKVERTCAPDGDIGYFEIKMTVFADEKPQ